MLEQFQEQQRSSFWFWRQALFAVLISLPQCWRVPWLALGFSAVWSSLLCSVYGRILRFRPVESFLFYWTLSLPWPFSLVGEMLNLAALDTVLLLTGLLLYFGLRRFPLKPCFQALAITFPVLVFGNFLVLFLSLVRPPVFLWYVVTGFIFFVTLLLSVTVTQVAFSTFSAERTTEAPPGS